MTLYLPSPCSGTIQWVVSSLCPVYTIVGFAIRAQSLAALEQAGQWACAVSSQFGRLLQLCPCARGVPSLPYGYLGSASAKWQAQGQGNCVAQKRACHPGEGVAPPPPRDGMPTPPRNVSHLPSLLLAQGPGLRLRRTPRIQCSLWREVFPSQSPSDGFLKLGMVKIQTTKVFPLLVH